MDSFYYVQNIITPKSNAFVIPVVILILFVVLFIGSIGIMYYMKNTKVIISNDYLTIKSIIYGRNIPFEKINVAGIKKINLLNDHDYNIKHKTNGIGFPNYYAGWMRLNNGDKAFVHLTDKTNVVLIPTEEYDILLSINDFDKIKEILETMKYDWNKKIVYRRTSYNRTVYASALERLGVTFG